jgi:hypothetical protein
MEDHEAERHRRRADQEERPHIPPREPGDRLGDNLEDDPQKRPDRAADEQLRLELVPDVRRQTDAARDKTIVSVFAIVQARNATSQSR